MSYAAFVVAALLLMAGVVLWIMRRAIAPPQPEAVRLNLMVDFHGRVREGLTHLTMGSHGIMDVGIRPTSASGDLAPVRGIEWFCNAKGILSVDGGSGHFSPEAPGVGMLTVTARTASGALLSESIELTITRDSP